MKKLFLPIVIATISHCDTLNYAVLDKHSSVLPENKIQIRTSYLKVNDTIDFLDIKESELGSYGDSFDTIGDMDGYDFNLRYGLSSKNSIFINYQRWNVDYGDSTLNNNKIDIYNRFNIYKTISFDIGYIQDKANPITIKNDKMLNSMINKIKPNSGIKIDNGSIIEDDGTITTINDSNGNQLSPYISIEDLQSSSYYTRLLFGYNISRSSFLDFYLGYRYNDIKTKIFIYPKTNADFNSKIEEFNIPNLNRDETVVTLGATYTLQLKRNIYEFNYEYNKVFRDDELSYANISHILNITIAKEIRDKLLLYIGGKVMFQQFNTDLPYLYNKYTQTQFDKKYGFAKVGVVYSF
ncbi:MAG: hypothetical protein U9Q30_09215 [Campylobacterota bacterium]|nr:hypothetical protein [Campylobacterota bacterium]